MCFIEDPHPPSAHLVQISVPEDEIQRRIQCFVGKKRDEIDLCNIMDFSNVEKSSQEAEHQDYISQQAKQIIENESMTCARVNSFVVKQQYSKCHLKVRRVENNCGPQTQPKYLNALDKLMVSTEGENVESYLVVQKNSDKRRLSNGEEFYMLKYATILERLANIDEHLNIPQSKLKNTYERLKTIEDRLLFLESISPEYAHFLDEKSQAKKTIGTHKSYDLNTAGVSAYEKKLFSVCEIEKIIQTFEEPTVGH